MAQADVNYLAVVGAAVVGMALGSLWYSPLVFGKQWLKAMGWSEQEAEARKKGATKAMAGMALGALLMAYVLAHIVDYAGAKTVGQGMQAGFWMWLGFVVTTAAGPVLFEGRSKHVYLINVGFHLAELLVAGALLAVWT